MTTAFDGNPFDAWAQDADQLSSRGFVMPDARAYLTPEMKFDSNLAMDALPSLATTPNSALPMIFTTYIDPEVVRISFAPTKAAAIAGERKVGDWTQDTALFTVIEATGETSAYGDFAENGRSGVNQNFPQRQSFHFQCMEEYGEREIERAGLAKLNYVSEINKASAESLNRFQNYSYFFGIAGLQNYGILNDPSLPAYLTPAQKAYGGVRWIVNNVVVATANEIYTDIQTIVYWLVNQSAGLIEEDAEIVISMAPQVKVALTQTNSFGIDVMKLVREHFPNIKFETAIQYGVYSATNPQGVVAGNIIQAFARKFEGNDTVYCAYTEKMRGHKMETRTSSFKRKVSSGTWGTIIRYPIAFTGMLGV